MSEQNDIPLKPGYYWAKWKLPSEGTYEGSLQTLSDFWEIVQVWPNSVDWYQNPREDEALLVSIPGVRESQERDGFFWGELVADLRGHVI